MKALLISLTAILLLSSCRSAEDAYLDGQRAEGSGNLRMAINYYIEAFQKEPTMLQAKSKVAQLGETVMAEYIGKAQSANRQGSGQDALKYLRDAENLERQARPYASNVTLPANYSQIKIDAQQIIIIGLLGQAKQAERSANWDEALKIYDEIEQFEPNANQRLQILKDRGRIKDTAFQQQITAAEQYFDKGDWQTALSTLTTAKKYADSLSEDQLLQERNDKYRNGIIIKEATALKAELDRKDWKAAEDRMSRLDSLKGNFEKSQLDAIRVMRAMIYNTWAEDLMAAKQYRTAFYKSAEVLKYDPENQEAIQRQQTAKKLGTQNFAVLPIMFVRGADNLAVEVDSAFNNGPARNMPPFTALVRDFNVRDAMRALRIEPQRITVNQAAAIGRRCNASFVVLREISFYRHAANYTASRTELVNRVGQPPTSTTIEIKKGVYTLKSTILYKIIDARSGKELKTEETKIDSDFDFEQAFLKEPVANLQLTEQQRSLLHEPGSPRDINNLEKASALNATEVFNKTILPTMEEVVP